MNNHTTSSLSKLTAFAVCAKGLEDSLFAELNTFDGLEFIKKDKGGVKFTSSAEIVSRLNLWSRIPSRILIQLGKTQITNADELFDFAFRIDWEQWFTPFNSFKVDVNNTGRMPKSLSANYAALKFKDGICDRFRSKFKNKRPNIDTKNPEIRIWIHFVNSLVTVSIDTSGEPLFKRGWRESKGIAPIKENLASGLISMTNWNMTQPLLDPMCGSGTFVIEAMQKFAKLPANFLPNKIRKFACENFSDSSPFKKIDWKFLREEALDVWADQNKIADIPQLIGMDVSAEMINISKKNASIALPPKIARSIIWEVVDISTISYVLKKDMSPGILVTNPPLGTRFDFSESSKHKFIKELGTVLKENFSEWTAWVLTDEKKFSSIIRLKHTKKFPVFNGDISCNWLSFEMVAGTMKR